MMAVSLIIVCLLLFVLLLIIDFKLGRSSHIKNPRTLPLQKTSGDYQLYQNGPALFEDMFRDIKNAEKQVDILFYIVDNDYISHNFLQLLKDKVRAGVSVRLLVDRLGGYKLTKQIRKDLKEAGIRLQFAEVPKFPFFFYKINRRNHRKITVIDGKISYVGGFNVGRNYIGENPKFGNWRDYHLRLTGSVVGEFHEVFFDDWFLATGEKSDKLPSTKEGSHEVEILPTDGVEMESEFIKIIQSARKEIVIGTPYFIPTRPILEELRDALKRKVLLHIMVPMKSDHPFVKEAGIPYLEDLYRKGAHVYLFDAGFYHSKVIIVDGSFADIGTANFDRRSFFLNKEVNTFVYDKAFIAELHNAFFKDAADAVPFDDHWLKHRSLGTRINQKIAVLLRPLL